MGTCLEVKSHLTAPIPPGAGPLFPPGAGQTQPRAPQPRHGPTFEHLHPCSTAEVFQPVWGTGNPFLGGDSPGAQAGWLGVPGMDGAAQGQLPVAEGPSLEDVLRNPCLG